MAKPPPKAKPTEIERRLRAGDSLALALKGADPAMKNEFGENLLHQAAKASASCDRLCEELCRTRPELARARDGMEMTPLMLAAYAGNIETLRALIPISELEARSDNGSTALMLACKNDQLLAARLLIDSGADIGAKDALGNTALHKAALSIATSGPLRDRAEALLIDALLAAGAEDAPNKDRLHAADYIARSQSPAAAKAGSEMLSRSVGHPPAGIHQEARKPRL